MYYQHLSNLRVCRRDLKLDQPWGRQNEDSTLNCQTLHYSDTLDVYTTLCTPWFQCSQKAFHFLVPEDPMFCSLFVFVELTFISGWCCASWSIRSKWSRCEFCHLLLHVVFMQNEVDVLIPFKHAYLQLLNDITVVPEEWFILELRRTWFIRTATSRV